MFISLRLEFRQVLQVIDLATGNSGKFKCIRKSEGVAIDQVRKQMYIVSE